MEAQSAAQEGKGQGGRWWGRAVPQPGPQPPLEAQPLPALLQHLHDLVVGSGDYVRKPLLAAGTARGAQTPS